MRVLHKAVACVVRQRPTGVDLLAFQHPTAGMQLPKGGIDPGESAVEAALRELREESGVTAVTVRDKVAELSMLVGASTDGSGESREQIWHVFWLEPTEQLPSTWEHQAEGSAEEFGLSFSYRWLVLKSARSSFHPHYHQAIDALVRFLGPTPLTRT